MTHSFIHCRRNPSCALTKITDASIDRPSINQAGETRAARSRKLPSCDHVCRTVGDCAAAFGRVRGSDLLHARMDSLLSSRILPARCFGFGSPSMLCHDEAKHPARPSTACATTAGAATHGEAPSEPTLASERGQPAGAQVWN